MRMFWSRLSFRLYNSLRRTTLPRRSDHRLNAYRPVWAHIFVAQSCNEASRRIMFVRRMIWLVRERNFQCEMVQSTVTWLHVDYFGPYQSVFSYNGTAIIIFFPPFLPLSLSFCLSFTRCQSHDFFAASKVEYLFYVSRLARFHVEVLARDRTPALNRYRQT